MSHATVVTEREVMVDWVAGTQRMSLPEAQLLSDIVLVALVNLAFPGGLVQFEEHTRDLRDYPEAPGEHYASVLAR